MTSEPATTGLLDLEFEAGSDGHTNLVRRAQRFPLRFTVPLHLDPADPGMAFVYVQNPTGGLFAGDRLLTQVRTGRGTRVHVTTQSATKVYRMPEGFASQRIAFELGEGAYAEYLPDLLIPQAGAALEQEVHARLARGAALVLAELIAPGRLARGEVFEYERVSLRTTAVGSEHELFTDTLVLEPGRRSPRAAGILGEHLYVGSLYAVAPDRDPGEILEKLDRMLPKTGEALAAVGCLPSASGAVVRVLAQTAATAMTVLEGAWAAARCVLVGSPPPARRK